MGHMLLTFPTSLVFKNKNELLGIHRQFRVWYRLHRKLEMDLLDRLLSFDLMFAYLFRN